MQSCFFGIMHLLCVRLGQLQGKIVPVLKGGSFTNQDIITMDPTLFYESKCNSFPLCNVKN